MIGFKFYGKVDNDIILDFYGNRRVDCFVHASEKEGLPVAIMEAESAGLPVVTTNAGGTSEMIEDNGVLLPLDCTADDMASAILSVLEASSDKKRKMSIASRNIWESKYNAVRNAEHFSEDILDVNGRNVIIITNGFPFDTGETSFICNELVEIARRCNSLTMIARVFKRVDKTMLDQSESYLYNSINNSELYNKITLIAYEEKWSYADTVISLFKFFIDKRTRCERCIIASSGKRQIVRYWESAKFFGKGERFFKWFADNARVLEGGREGLLYTFWNSEPTLGLCLNKKSLGNVALVTRCHGYDYQDIQWEKGLRKPFAETTDRYLDKLFFVSKTGLEWYINRYNITYDSNKYFYSYLGSKDPKIHEENRTSSGSNAYRIVSCSSLISLKRVHMIIDALAIIDKRKQSIKIEWIHFGDGPLRSELEKKAYKIGYCL